MPGRMYFVVTHDKKYNASRANALAVESIDAVIEKSKKNGNEIFVIGGGKIFEQVIDVADKLYLTNVEEMADA